MSKTYIRIPKQAMEDARNFVRPGSWDDEWTDIDCLRRYGPTVWCLACRFAANALKCARY